MSEEVLEMNAAGIDLTDLGDDPAQDNIADFDPEEVPEEEPEYDDPDRRNMIIEYFNRVKAMRIASRHITDVDIGGLSSMPFDDLEKLFDAKKAQIKAGSGNLVQMATGLLPLGLEQLATAVEEEGSKHLAAGYADALTKDYGFNQSLEVCELDLVERGITGPKLPAPVMATVHAAKVYLMNRANNKEKAEVSTVKVDGNLASAIGRL